MSLSKFKPGLAPLLLALTLCPFASGQQPPQQAATQPATQTSTEELTSAEQGMDRLMNADFDGATEIFRQIQKTDPESPLGYLLEADVNWWKIYLVGGNLIDPDVFESLSEAATPYDPDFHHLSSLAIHKAEAQIRARKDVARDYLYEGLGYALQGRLEALRDHSLAAARDGKKMRNLSLEALKLDPSLIDANLPAGLYNYFEATLPGYVRMLRFLIGLPKGDREVGLRQLQEAAEKGQIVKQEAKFHLAKDYSRHIEQQYAKSLALFQQMAQEFPDNPLWDLLVGSLEIRLGQDQQGEVLYRKVINTSTTLPAGIWSPLHQQAERALARRHPGQTPQPSEH